MSDFRTVTTIHDPITPDVCVKHPGVIHGCGIFVHDHDHFGIMPGSMLFGNGFSLDVQAPVYDICKVPYEKISTLYYIVATIDKQDVAFIIVDVKEAEKGHFIAGGLPLALNNAIVLARVRIPRDPDAEITVYNILPEGEGNGLHDFRLLPEPDGYRAKFYLPVIVESHGSVNLTVDGIGQTEGEDYVVNVEKLSDGSLTSIISFLNEKPRKGSDIRATIYIGKAASDEIR